MRRADSHSILSDGLPPVLGHGSAKISLKDIICRMDHPKMMQIERQPLWFAFLSLANDLRGIPTRGQTEYCTASENWFNGNSMLATPKKAKNVL